MRVLPTRLHGVIDYLWGILLLALPFGLGWTLGGPASWIAWIFGAGAIGYSVLTAYEVGVVPAIPMPVHLALDAIAGIVLVALASLVPFEGRAGAIFAGFGLFSVVASLVTRTAPAAPSLRG